VIAHLQGRAGNADPRRRTAPCIVSMSLLAHGGIRSLVACGIAEPMVMKPRQVRTREDVTAEEVAELVRRVFLGGEAELDVVQAQEPASRPSRSASHATWRSRSAR
jgi:hypothetical protein